MKIPDKVKIGGLIYDIVLMEPKADKLCIVKNWGEVNHKECKIYIDKDLDKQIQAQTLLHEIIHIFEFLNDMDSPDSYIQTISACFYAFLKDNNLLKE